MVSEPESFSQAIDQWSDKLTIPSAIGKYIKYIRNIKSFSENTVRAYQKELNLLTSSVEILCGKNFLISSKTDLAPVLEAVRRIQRNSSKLAPRSRQRQIACYKSFFRFLHEQELLPKNLGHQLMAPRTPRDLPHYLSVDECLLLLKTLSTSVNSENTRNSDPQLLNSYLLVLLLYGAGLRVSEACQLQWQNIDSNQRVLRVTGKGRKERLISAPQIVFVYLEKQKTKEPNSIFIWGQSPLHTRQAYQMVRSAGQRAMLQRPIHPHVLSHSYATHLLSGGGSLRHIQSLLGHATLSSTEKYTHLTTDDLARTLEKIHPLGESKKISK